jgi:hypothetical protein
MRNKLFTASVDKMLFKQYPLGDDLEKQKVVAKIFNPYGDARWYLLNSDPEDPDYIWAIVSMFGNVEIGSVSRSELLGVRVRPFGLPLERDLYFTPQNAAEVYRGLLDGKFYNDGGEVEEMKQLWFVTDSRGAVKNISTSISAAEVFLASALKYDGVINYVKVPLKDWESEKVSVGNIRGYASSFWKNYKKGGVTDDLVKELRKLQRDLNSSRLSTYMKGDNSAEEMARQAERAAKLARFNEVLKLLNESGAKFAKGGHMAKGGGVDKKLEVYQQSKWLTKEQWEKWNEYVKTGKIDGKKENNIFTVARFIGVPVAKINAYEIEQRQKKYKYAKGGEMANGGSIGNFKIGDYVYHRKHNTIGKVIDVFDRGDVRTDADGVVYTGELEIYDEGNPKHKKAHIAPSTQRELDSRFAKGGMTNLVGNSPVKKYPIDKSNIDIVE